jgi:hypothetical protein
MVILKAAGLFASGLAGPEKIKNRSVEEPLTAYVLYFTLVGGIGYRLAEIFPLKLAP